jgi:hypothetical protein
MAWPCRSDLGTAPHMACDADRTCLAGGARVGVVDEADAAAVACLIREHAHRQDRAQRRKFLVQEQLVCLQEGK